MEGRVALPIGDWLFDIFVEGSGAGVAEEDNVSQTAADTLQR